MSVRAPVGSVAIADHHACIGRGVAVLKPKNNVSWLWLKHLLLNIEPQWSRVSQGSTFDAVNSKDMKCFPINVPTSFLEQDHIGQTLEVADLECSSLREQIAKLRTEKKALMQQLLTGKRRVTV
jgi:type I restriction enzyme S subunit